MSNKEKAEESIKKILTSANTKLEAFGGFDMNNGKSIKKSVELLPAGEKYDIIFLQSGGMVVADTYQFVNTNGQNIEKTISQNVLGGYITLLELNKKGLLRHDARIVFAGGEGARGIKGMIDRPDFKSVNAFRSYILQGGDNYSDINALGASKYMSALLVQKLSLVDPDHSYVWFSPGLTAGTNGLASVSNPKRFIMEKIGFPLLQAFGLAQNPQQAAQKYVYCLNGDYGVSGDLLGAPEGKTLGSLVDQKPMNKALTNHLFRDELWKIITQSCGNIKFN